MNLKWRLWLKLSLNYQIITDEFLQNKNSLSFEFFTVNTKLAEKEILASKDLTAVKKVTSSWALTDDHWFKRLLLASESNTYTAVLTCS